MIDRIIIENFKSLRNVDLSLGRMNLLIGANASGKSNFLDSLRVLQGIGKGFTIREVLDGKSGTAISDAWDGIRGGSAKSHFAGAPETAEVTIEVHGEPDRPTAEPWRFVIGFSPAACRLTREELRFRSDEDRRTDRDSDGSLLGSYTSPPLGDLPSLDATLGDQSPGARAYQAGPEETSTLQPSRGIAAVKASLADMQLVDPAPDVLRQRSGTRNVCRMGERGQDFAGLVDTICRNPETKDAYLWWLRELLPTQVDDVGVLQQEDGGMSFRLREDGTDFPASALSAGTLRFAAIAAAFLQPNLPKLMLIESIETGVHASRLRSLVEMLGDQAAARSTQIVATTHSPVVLDWLQEADYATAFLCKRNESTRASAIRPLTEVPRLLEVLKTQRLSDLLTEGWLELEP